MGNAGLWKKVVIVKLEQGIDVSECQPPHLHDTDVVEKTYHLIQHFGSFEDYSMP